MQRAGRNAAYLAVRGGALLSRVPFGCYQQPLRHLGPLTESVIGGGEDIRLVPPIPLQPLLLLRLRLRLLRLRLLRPLRRRPLRL